MKIEHRSTSGEIRATTDEGIIEGYIAVWDTVDSYGSMFQRGAFTKTLRERGSRIKVLWNHQQEVIGTPIELREDDRGVFFRGQLVLSVPKARETFELIKAAAIDTFSFGFRAVKDKWVNNLRVITEVMLMEVSPVIFEANSEAVITGVRAMPAEQRAQQYQETYSAYELGRRGDLILSALFRTLDDIWYGGSAGDQVRELVASAITEFSSMYSAYTDELVTLSQRDLRGSPVQIATRKYLAEKNMTPEALAANTSLTLSEVTSLLVGTPAVDMRKLGELPDTVREAINVARAAKVEALCDELRSGLEPAEVARIRGLLPSEEPDVSTEILSRLMAFRASLTS